MTQFEPRSQGTGIEVFFIKYRKPITVLCVVLLVYSPIYIYLEAPAPTSAHIYQVIGFWLDALIMYLAVPLGMLIYTRRAYTAHLKEVAEIDAAHKE